MCRALVRQHPKQMAPQKNVDSYVARLDTLKQVLKPYRDNNANCLRAITRSARVNLNKHWKSLENMFAAGHDDHRKERAQNAVNERLQMENVENARPATAYATIASDAVDKFRQLRM